MPQSNPDRSASGSAKITIERNSRDDVQTRQIVVVFDGERKGELLFGDSLTFSASPGRHTLRVDNTWNHKDTELNVAEGSDFRFVVKSTAGQFSRFLLVALGAGPIYVSIESVPSPGQT